MNILIIGAGEIGFQLAKRLSNEKHNISLVENDPVKAKYALEHLDALVVEGSGSSFESLKQADIQNAEIFAALTNVDEVNLFACNYAKKFNVGTTIARVRNPEFLNEDFILNKDDLGADVIIQPEKLTADAIVRLVRQSSATDVVSFDKGKTQLIGIRLDDNAEVIHTKLREFGEKYGNPPINIVAIKRKQFTIIPSGDDILLESDQIFIICEPSYIPEALKLFGKANKKVQNLMIVGGGLIGEFVAAELENEMNVKIIEKDEKKSSRLATKLKKSLVINGDGSDIDLLTFEGFSDMDEFVAVTGDDESNIITSLVANHLDVPRTITLVSKLEYQSLAPSIGMDSVVSKQLITVNVIQKYIRRKHVAFFAELPGVDVEMIEFIAGNNAIIVRKPLKKINFPKDSVVGAVIRNDKRLEIPKGDTQIKPGEKVIVFCLPKNLLNIEKLF